MNVYKIIFLGDSSTGAKTSLMHRITDNFFPTEKPYSPTVGVDFNNKIIQSDFGEIKLQMWDTSGQYRFKKIIESYLKGCHCIILGYDVTNKESFKSIRNSWYDYIKNNIGVDFPLLYLVGNKIDKIEERILSDEEGISLANDLNMKYIGVFAKTGENVDILINDIVNSLIKKFPINKNDTKKSKKEGNKNEPINKKNKDD